MRIIRFMDPEGHTHFGLPPEDTQARTLSGELLSGLSIDGKSAVVDHLLPPLDPTNIYCIGLNYRGHAAESKMATPETPLVFMKPTSTVCAAEDPVRLPACQHDDEVDYECELVAVIGQTARNVPVARALEHVLGYTCGNDISARHWQLQAGGGQWIRGKGFDTFCPLGPVLVTADEVPDPQQLGIRTRLNGAVMQDHNTSNMIFSVAELISFLSQDTTLLPGTVIMTGTPEGVGFARDPQVFLQPGDQLEVEIDGIGTLRNPVVAAGVD